MKKTKNLVVAAFCGVAIACSGADVVPDRDSMEGASLDDAADQATERAEDEATERTEAMTLQAELTAWVEGGHRSEENRVRNEYRNPVATLMFFGIQPDYQVVEIWPGSGWYAEILAPFVAGEGSYAAGNFLIRDDDPEDYRTQVGTEFLDRMERLADHVGDVHVGTFAPGEVVDLGEPGSADMVLTFRNLHNMYNNGNLEEALEAFNEVLKPGGTLGIVQHRAPEGSDPEETATNGYIAQDWVIETVEAAGFEFEEASDINANPNDTADHEHGVWSLPPSLRGGEETAEEFMAIGESDRMTLRFVKPEGGDQRASGE